MYISEPSIISMWENLQYHMLFNYVMLLTVSKTFIRKNTVQKKPQKQAIFKLNVNFISPIQNKKNIKSLQYRVNCLQPFHNKVNGSPVSAIV